MAIWNILFFWFENIHIRVIYKGVNEKESDSVVVVENFLLFSKNLKWLFDVFLLPSLIQNTDQYTQFWSILLSLSFSCLLAIHFTHIFLPLKKIVMCDIYNACVLPCYHSFLFEIFNAFLYTIFRCCCCCSYRSFSCLSSTRYTFFLSFLRLFSIISIY